MKKLLSLTILCLACVTATAQVFEKGDRIADLSIGVGSVAYGKSYTTFDQHFGMEWGVASIADVVTIGVGFTVNNSFASFGKRTILGIYDYYYSRRVNSGVIDYNGTQQVHREGVGSADAVLFRDDVNAQATVSFHYSPLQKLDVFAKVGAGIGVMNYTVGKISNEQGFSSNSHTGSLGQGGTVMEYSYNDLDHVKWDKPKSKAVPAISVYSGAAYYLTDNWGVEALLGLISTNVWNEIFYGNSYGVFAVGVTYKF